MTLAVFAIVATALLSSLTVAARRLEYLADYRQAANRAASVEVFLRAPAVYCGYGMPVEPERYMAAFGGHQYAPFNWDGPINAGTARKYYTDGDDKRVDNTLFIAYAQPGTTRVKELTILGADNNVIQLDRVPEPSEFDVSTPSRLLCKSFICLGSAVPPRTLLKVTALEKRLLTTERTGIQNVTLQKGDVVHLFRAMIVFAFQDHMYSYDFSGSGRQPRLNGVCDLRFRVDLSARKLTVFVMTRGEKTYKERRPIKGVDTWPEEYAADTYDNKASYQLLVTKIVMELPNCREQTFLNAQNVTEAF